MPLSRSAKLGLWAFAVVDVVLIAVFVALLLFRAERQQVSDLRDIGTTIYPTALALDEFALVDQSGNPFGKQNLLGHWSLVFFGFTSCPDICPLTMAELEQFYGRALERADLERPQIVLITVDPERDTPEAMADYLNSFHDEFIGLTGNPATLAGLAQQLYVASNRAPEHGGHDGQDVAEDTTDYLIEHSSHISVINPRGELYAVMRPPHRDADLLESYLALTEN